MLVTKENVILAMARLIKKCAKNVDERKGYVKVPITYNNWFTRNGKERVWSNTEIEVGVGTAFSEGTFVFKDKQITEEDFLVMVYTALKESGCKGKVKSHEWLEFQGFATIKHREFDGLIVMGKPCKEFLMLNRLLEKYTNKSIQELQVKSANVCGKRNNWEEETAYYLDYQPKVCKKAIDFIRETRKGKDVLFLEVKEELNYGDEGDYKNAIYNESEWYGRNYNYVELKVTTPKMKEKGRLEVKAYVGEC